MGFAIPNADIQGNTAHDTRQGVNDPPLPAEVALAKRGAIERVMLMVRSKVGMMKGRTNAPAS